MISKQLLDTNSEIQMSSIPNENIFLKKGAKSLTQEVAKRREKNLQEIREK